MEDPPSISEGCGGRVTDYRINVSFVGWEVYILGAPRQIVRVGQSI